MSLCCCLQRGVMQIWNLLIKAGVEEDAILLMDYDDYDGDRAYEAFAFLGESYDDHGETCYKGSFWFVGAD